MDNLSEWLNLFVRWFHVVAGITWIGQTYLFNWMERNLADPDPARNISGRLWMVHGGGFYLVEKQKVPEIMPRTLHWFKWESALTWMSGILLLSIVYYAGGLMAELGSDVGESRAVAVGLGLLVLAWPAYELLWRSPLGNNEIVGAAVSYVLILAVASYLPRFMSARAAYIHVGAMLGTIMTANVWLRILPAQTRMIAAVTAGQAPDMSLGARAKQCSKHNTYMSVPLVFIMLSNHFPTASYGQEHSWAVLGALIGLGWGAAKLMRG